MIGRVVTNIGQPGLATAHDSFHAPVFQARRRYRVFTVITAFLRWQQALPVAKYGAIFFAAKGSALGQGNKFYDVFGQDMTTGNPMGGAINPIGSANGNFTMSLNNLSAGTYTLTMLVGRGNNYGAGNTSSFSLDGTGISNISASLDDYSTGSGATLNGATVTGNTHTGDWMLITYTFDVAADGTRLDIQSQGGTGNINALALTSVPEPATASLGLLGLGALLMRRRRA